MTEKYRYLGDHPDHITVGDKSVPVEPGDFVDLDDSDTKNEDNAWRINDGLLKCMSDFENKSAPKVDPPMVVTKDA